MSYATIQFEVSHGIARLRFNRPEKRNSFNRLMHEEVRGALHELPGAARVLLLTGSGGSFCAGQDLTERVTQPGEPPLDLGASIENYYKPLCLALRALPLPVVAGVNGVAAGAGANIALACDLVVATHSASFIQSFSKLGLVPDSGGSWTLPRLVGNARAFGMTLLGERITAAQAQDWGMIWRCVEDDLFEGALEELLLQLAASPTLGLAATKRALYASPDLSFAQSLDLERDLQRSLGRSQDYAEGVAAFRQKRAPTFKGA